MNRSLLCTFCGCSINQSSKDYCMLIILYKDYLLATLVPSVILLHLICSPYTKVEESFNIQAIHDILTYGVPLRNPDERFTKRYDHFTFPGSVPRSFVGALVVSGVSAPFVSWLQDTAHVQILVRGLIGLGNAFALLAFQNAVSHSYGRIAGSWYLALQSSQFHIMYYASRTLPNSFAFGLSTLSFRYLMLSNFGPRARRAKRNRLALYLLTIAGIVFRAELGLLVAVQSAWLLLFRRVSLRHVILPAGITAMTVGLVITVSVDSFFWQSFPLWPEWVAFRFNALSGKSAEWGTSPWHYYFTSSIPKLVLNPFALFVCLPLALADRLNRRFSIDVLAPQLAFVALFSLLPHKEWRFVVYVIPSITAVCSAGASWIWVRRHRSFAFRFLAITLVASTVATFLASTALLVISSLNYPGATALSRLHQLTEEESPARAMIRVHLDNLSCQTGATRFLQRPVPGPRQGPQWLERPVWYYDKTENKEMLQSAEFWERFDYVLAEEPDKVLGTWDVLEVVEGFAGLVISQSAASFANKSSFGMDENSGIGRLVNLWSVLETWARRNMTKGWWIGVKMEPKIHIMRKVDS